MIDRLKIHNFQAIKNLDIELGRLTVIVGHSNSGKSSLRRSLEMLASNRRGSDYVTVGEKVASVGIVTERGSVTIERGEKHGSYKVVKDGKELVFTKLGGHVPDQVTETLRIQPGKGSINFAGQHDFPYLLDKSGQEVSKILGELTNVSTIFEAVREANRKRSNASSKLKTRESDLQEKFTQAREYKGLKKQLDACSRAEEFLEQAKAISAQVKRLDELVAALESAEAELETVRVVHELPATTRLEESLDRHKEFTSLLSKVSVSKKEMKEALTKKQHYIDEQEKLQETLSQLLAAAGICPTCDQEIKA